MGKVKDLPDGRRMLGGGCESCPVEACATSTYRGSACASQRALYGLGDPLTNGDRTRAMSDKEFAAWVVFQTGYRESAFSEMTYFNILTGNDDSRENAEKAMLTWLKQPVKEAAPYEQ